MMRAQGARRGIAAAMLAGGVLAGCVAFAAPAQAHNPNYICTKSDQGFRGGMSCAGGVLGDRARIRVVCQRIWDGHLITLYSPYIQNGTQYVDCIGNGSYEVLRVQGEIIYSDGHTATF